MLTGCSRKRRSQYLSHFTMGKLTCLSWMTHRGADMLLMQHDLIPETNTTIHRGLGIMVCSSTFCVCRWRPWAFCWWDYIILPCPNPKCKIMNDSLCSRAHKASAYEIVIALASDIHLEHLACLAEGIFHKSDKSCKINCTITVAHENVCYKMMACKVRSLRSMRKYPK